MRCMHGPPSRRSKISYAELQAACGRVAALLRLHGLAPGDTVSLVMPNGLGTLQLL